ncbi:ArsA family ATPase [Actinospongicola halichondriae]|uniref:ArsA family ATPase n=1 Tax=Actinospongicola halichondriae TaxID=3236844 RepID=UPI003D4CB66D
MRILLFTGKGGVGKTTTAAATALRCADAGHRTIVLSTDPAHSLSDAFDVDLGDLAVEISPGLWGQQLDAQDRMEDSWEQIRTYLQEVFRWGGIDEIEAEELSVVPGLDEIFALTDIKRYAASGEWDVIVVDCAPTAETIRLLSLPAVLAWWMERLFPMGRRVNKVVSPLLGQVTGLPVPDDDVFGAVERFYDRLDGVKEILTDREVTSARLVVNPERMVVAEARRTYTYLSLFGYAVDAVIANRLLPDEIEDPWFESWKQRHLEHLETIEEGFAPLPILRASLAPHELVGIDRLREFGTVLYGDADPAERMADVEPLRLERVADGDLLVIDLPFTDKDELALGRRRDELLVRVGPYRRSVLLPDSLRGRKVIDAALRDGALQVLFGH